MKKTRLNAENLDSIVGGVISGKINGEDYSMSFNQKSGNYEVTMSGITSQFDETNYKKVLNKAFGAAGDSIINEYLGYVKDTETHHIDVVDE